MRVQRSPTLASSPVASSEPSMRARVREAIRLGEDNRTPTPRYRSRRTMAPSRSFASCERRYACARGARDGDRAQATLTPDYRSRGGVWGRVLQARHRSCTHGRSAARDSGLGTPGSRPRLAASLVAPRVGDPPWVGKAMKTPKTPEDALACARRGDGQIDRRLSRGRHWSRARARRSRRRRGDSGPREANHLLSCRPASPPRRTRTSGRPESVGASEK